MAKVPKHVGLIIDGNRRFAKRLMLKPWKGHEWGAKKVEALFDWCKELGIKELTLYAFSLENFNRPKKEFQYLMNLFNREFSKVLTNKKIHKNKVRVNFIGRLDMFPRSLQSVMKKVMESTKKHSNYIVNFAMAYGGRHEIIDAAKRVAEKIKSGELDINMIDEKTFEQELYTSSQPDLIIRTSGEKRTSGFLLYQAAYSEWIFIDKLWPEFEKKDLITAIEDYKKRERRFGR